MVNDVANFHIVSSSYAITFLHIKSFTLILRSCIQLTFQHDFFVEEYMIILIQVHSKGEEFGEVTLEFLVFELHKTYL